MLRTGLFSVLLLTIAAPAPAQVIPDDTLGREASRVRPLDGTRDLIDRGARRGSNLFHSFEQFSIEAGRGVYFASPSSIENILSRVTGEARSDIFGTLGVLGDANLFFLNPNGIVFGPNARLDVAGSFVASTSDRFTFPDGSHFSATAPDVPPLLTVNLSPGLQPGGGRSPLLNQGQLVVGEDLTLQGSLLNLEGTLTAGQNLTLQGDRLQIRDSAAAPFVATAGEYLTLTGGSIDIFALAHPLSELVSGGNMVLRSRSTVIGDARYRSGGDFRIESGDGALGRLISPNDPVIRVAGDVAFDSYTGASLHIFAGGSVTVPGAIEITGADPVNGLVESVVTSDGATVQIDGQRTPTLDVRAGTLAVTPEGTSAGAPAVTTGEATSGDISIGSISNPGGSVFLTNQYQPNLTLAGGDITIGSIDTSVARQALAAPDGLTAVSARGGDVVVDGRGNVALTGNVDTSAIAEIGDFSTAVLGDGLAVARGGDIRLMAEGVVTTQALTTSAAADVSVDDGLAGDGLASDATATATGGNITVAAQTFSASGALSTRASSEVAIDAIGDVDTDPSADVLTAQAGEIGVARVSATGGDIEVDAERIATGDIATAASGSVDALAFADSFDFLGDTADNIALAGGTIGVASGAIAGGNLNLTAQRAITTGELSTGANAFSDVDASAIVREDQAVSAINVTGGSLGPVSLALTGGDITLTADGAIATENLSTASLADTNTLAIAAVDTFGSAATIDAAGGAIGPVRLVLTGGNITLTTSNRLTTGDQQTSAVVGRFFDSLVDAGANVTVVQPAAVTAVTTQGGDVAAATLSATAGDVALVAGGPANLGNVRAGAQISGDVEANAEVTEDSGARIARASLGGGAVGPVAVAASGGDLTIDAGGPIIAENLFTTANALLDIDARPASITDIPALAASGGRVGDTTGAAVAGSIALVSSDRILTEEMGTGARVAVAALSAAESAATGLDDLSIAVSSGAIDLTAALDILTSSLSSEAGAFSSREGKITFGDNPFAGAVAAGDIALTSQMGTATLRPESSIRSNIVRGNGNGGDIRIDGASVTLVDNFLLTSVSDRGSAGDITLRADGAVTLLGSRLFTLRELSATGSGDAGAIEVTGSAITLRDFSFLNTATFGTGNAGRVFLEATDRDIVLNDSSIFSLTTLAGDAAPISLEAAGAVRLSGNSVISSTVAVGASGDGADITIRAAEGLFLSGVGPRPDPAVVGTDPTLVEQEPNDIRDQAQIIDGAFALAPDTNVLFSEEVPFVRVEGSNDGSRDIYAFTVDAVGTQITFDVDSATQTNQTQALAAALLLLNDQGEVLDVSGNAPVRLGAGGSNSPDDAYLTYIFTEPGTYFIALESDAIQPSVTPADTYNLNISRVDSFLVNSGITTQTRSTGRSGNITIHAPRIELRNGAQISAETLGDGPAGNLTLAPLAEGAALDIALETGTQITASTLDAGPSGSLNISAPEIITLQGGGRIAVETSGSGDAGSIRLDTARLRVQDGVTVSAQSNAGASGDAGDITVNAGERVTLRSGGQLSVETSSRGQAGDITINTPRLTVARNAAITATATRTAAPTSRGGSIFLNASTMDLSGRVGVFAETQGDAPAGRLRLQPFGADTELDITLRNAARVSASTTAIGDGGDLAIAAPERVRIQGDGSIAVETTGAGDAGDLSIQTGRLDVFGDVTLSALSGAEATGSGGNLDILADGVTIASGAEVTVSSIGAIAGDLRIDANRLRLENGRVSASTVSGQGGDILLTDLSRAQLVDSAILASAETGAAGRLRLTATDEVALSNSRLSVEALAGGRAGDLRLQAGSLTVDDSAITVSSPLGTAGNLAIAADTITLNNGEISAETGVNAGSGELSANVGLMVQDLLVLRDNSIIAAQANAGANGGNIRIDASEGFIVADGRSNIDIIASAQLAGDGGRIDISTLRLFGLQERPGLFDALRANDTNDISASSEFGISGTIIIDELGVDPVQRAAELPTDTSPPPLAQGCRGTAGSSRFVDTRRGGLPTQTADLASGNRLWEAVGEPPEPSGAEPSPQVIEAQGWRQTDQGQIILLAETTEASGGCYQ